MSSVVGAKGYGKGISVVGGISVIGVVGCIKQSKSCRREFKVLWRSGEL